MRVAIGGATGWAGSALTDAVIQAKDLSFVGGLSRSHSGQPYKEVYPERQSEAPLCADMASLLTFKPDVYVEYTKPGVALKNVKDALSAGVHVVVGTSGISDREYEDVHQLAVESQCSVLAAGNFALTAVLLQKFSEMAARYIPHREIIDYSHEGKVDAPSGTARELAFRLGKQGESSQTVSLDKVNGTKECRGGRLSGTQVHSVRLPGHVLGIDVVFGLPDQKLIIKHEAGSSAVPYVDGALLAIRSMGSFVGLKRGLDSVMNL